MTLPNYGIPDEQVAADKLTEMVGRNSADLSAVANAAGAQVQDTIAANRKDLNRVKAALTRQLNGAGKANAAALAGVGDALAQQLAAAQAQLGVQLTAGMGAAVPPPGTYSVWQFLDIAAVGPSCYSYYVLPDGQPPQHSQDQLQASGLSQQAAQQYAAALQQAADAMPGCNSGQPAPPPPSSPQAPVVVPGGPSVPWNAPHAPPRPRPPGTGIPCGPLRECWREPGPFTVWAVP